MKYTAFGVLSAACISCIMRRPAPSRFSARSIPVRSTAARSPLETSRPLPAIILSYSSRTSRYLNVVDFFPPLAAMNFESDGSRSPSIPHSYMSLNASALWPYGKRRKTSSQTRGTAALRMQECHFFIAAAVLRSMRKPSFAENLTARIILTGSSRNLISGSPIVLMIFFSRSFIPPTQSITEKSFMS